MSDLHAILDALGDIQRTLGEHGAKFDTIDRNVTTMKTDLVDHMGDEGRAISDIMGHVRTTNTKLEAIEKGFPRDPASGDRNPYYHAAWHERDAEKSKDAKDFRNKLLLAVAGALTVAALSGAGAVFLAGAKHEVVSAMENKK